MKTIIKIIIGSIIGSLVFLFLSSVPVMFGFSWWWFFGTLIFLITGWLIFGAVRLGAIISKRKPVQLEVDLSKAVNRAIYEMKYDTENPDNFHVINIRLRKIGKEGAEMTPVAILEGWGTETNTRRVVIINMANPEKEIAVLNDPTPEEWQEEARLMADHPPERTIKEEFFTGQIDLMGNPMKGVRTTSPTMIERKQKEAEAEEKANSEF